jgi:MFS family permease
LFKSNFILPVLLPALYRYVYNLSFFFWSVFLLARGLSGAQVGVVLAVNTIVSLLMSLPSGLLHDRYEAKNVFLVGLGLQVVFLVSLFWVRDFGFLVLLFLVAGVAHRLIEVSLDGYSIKAHQDSTGQKILDYFLLFRFTGIALGILTSSFLIGGELLDWILVANLIGVVILAILSFFLPKISAVDLTTEISKQSFADPKVYFFLIGLFVFALHFGAEAVSYVPFLTTWLGLEGVEVGLYMALPILCMGVGSFYFNRIIGTKVASGYFLVFGLLASGVFHVLMVNTDVWLSLLFRTLHELGDAAVFTFMYRGLTDLFAGHRVGNILGVVSLNMTLAASVSALFYGYLIDHYAITAPLVVSGFLGAILAIMTLFVLVGFKQLRNALFY